jgi:hypothetical protein
MDYTQQISMRSSKDEELDTGIDNSIEVTAGRGDISASEATDDPDAMDDTDLAVGDIMDRQDW